MNLRSLSLLFGSLAGFAALSGCGDEPRGTPGQLGTLRFEYATDGVCEGCAMDHEVLVGSRVDVEVHGIHPRVHVQVRSTAPEIAGLKLTSRCRFVGHAGCRDAIGVVTTAVGDADLEIFDDWTGTVLDRVTIKVRDAAALDAVVKVTSSSGGDARTLAPTAAGLFELEVDSDVQIVSSATSASGAPLIATSAAIHGAFHDEDVLAPRPASGALPTEYARAKRPGLTDVDVIGGGATRTLSFRVKSP